MTTTDVMKLPSADREQSVHRFDYKGLHRYTITLPAFKERRLFIDQERILSLLSALRDSAAGEKFDVYAYCFLPDRLLLIIRGRDEGSDMKQFLKAFRTRTNELMAPLLGHPVWSKKYTERVLRKAEETRTIAREMFLTPVRMGLVGSLSDYPFFGSFVVSVPKILGEPAGFPRRSPDQRRRPDAKRKPFPRGRSLRGGPPRRPRKP